MAGFELTLIGRFWVTPKGNRPSLAVREAVEPNLDTLGALPGSWVHVVDSSLGRQFGVHALQLPLLIQDGPEVDGP